MTFKEASEALKNLAGGKFRSLKFQLVTYADGTEHAVCTAYIDGIGHTPDFPNYELTLASMESLILQKDQPRLVDEMMPE